MDNDSFSTIALMLAFIALSAFFSAGEMAYSSLNRTRLKNMARGGNPGAQKALRLSEKYDKLLSTILIGNNVVNIALTAVATVWFVNLFGNAGASISTVIVTIVVLVFGEISPKMLAKESPERLAIAFAAPLGFLVTLFTPVNWLVSQWKKLLSHLIKHSDDGGVTEGELLTLVDEAREDGGIDEDDKQLIKNIFEFDDITAGEISTHRTELAMLWLSEDGETWERTIRESRHTIYPVCGESVDDVVGVLNAKDYFWLEDKSRASVLERAVRPAYFVPETVKADALFRDMKRERERCAIIVDEYGGVNGVVTMSDLVEQIVGEFDDDNNGDPAPADIEPIGEGRWRILGSAELDDVSEALAIALPCDDYETFGGMVLGSLSSIPPDGTDFEVVSHGLKIKVTELLDRRVVSCEVEFAPPAADGE